MDEATVSKLVALMEGTLGKTVPPRRADLRIVKPMTAAERATEAWQWFDVNQQAANFADIDQSARARHLRQINRIAMEHGWGVAVARAVDKAGVPSLAAMSDDQLEALAARMDYLVDCSQTGCEPDDDAF